MFNKLRNKLGSSSFSKQDHERKDKIMNHDERQKPEIIPKMEINDDDDWASIPVPTEDDHQIHQDEHNNYEVLFREVEDQPTISNFSRRKRIFIDENDDLNTMTATIPFNYVENHSIVNQVQHLENDDEITMTYLPQQQQQKNLQDEFHKKKLRQLVKDKYNDDFNDGWNTSSDEENNDPWMDDDFAIAQPTSTTTTTQMIHHHVEQRHTSVLDPSIRLWNANAKPMWTSDVFFSVYAFLDDIFDMIHLSRVCRESYKAFRDPYLWRNEIENRKIRKLGFKKEESENGDIECLDVIYAYCKELMEYKMTKLRREGENEKGTYIQEQNKLKEEKKQALQQRQTAGLAVTGIISLILICFSISRMFFFLIAYFLFSAAVVGVLLAVNTSFQMRFKKQQLMLLNIVIAVISFVLFQIEELNFLFMILGAVAFSYWITFKFIVTSEHSIQHEFLVKQRRLFQSMSNIDDKYCKKIRELQEIAKRIPTASQDSKKKKPLTCSTTTNSEKRLSKCTVQ